MWQTSCSHEINCVNSELGKSYKNNYYSRLVLPSMVVNASFVWYKSTYDLYPNPYEFVKFAIKVSEWNERKPFKMKFIVLVALLSIVVAIYAKPDSKDAKPDSKDAKSDPKDAKSDSKDGKSDTKDAKPAAKIDRNVLQSIF